MRRTTTDKPRRKSWLRREDGSATIEFVILFPIIMTLFLSSVEVSVFVARAALLDRAVDINVRALRLGIMSPMTADELKRRICEDALILSDCENAMMIELVPISTETWQFPPDQITCVERDANIQPVVDFIAGGQNEIMLVRACAVLNPFFGSTPFVLGMPLDASGGYAIAATSIFVNEP